MLVTMERLCSPKALSAQKGPQPPTGRPVPIQAPKGDLGASRGCPRRASDDEFTISPVLKEFIKDILITDHNEGEKIKEFRSRNKKIHSEKIELMKN